MSTESFAHPFFDMLADFMLASDFKQRFQAPLNILEDPNNPNDFALIPEICKYLDIDPARIILQAKDIADFDPAGMIEIFEDGGARISYTNEASLCWKRFIIIKELMHLVIERLDYSNLPPISIPDMLASVCNPGALNLLDCYDVKTSLGQAEQSAWVLAEQIIIPWFVNDPVRANKTSDFTEAFNYRAPKNLIENRRIGEHTPSNVMSDAYERRIKKQ